jgi:pilus assembly protein Flp/PilA
MLKRLRQQVRTFAEREEGPTAVEYAVMLSLIIVVCLAAISIVGARASATFASVGATLGSGS